MADDIVTQAQERLEEYGIEAGRPEQVRKGSDDGERPYATYSPEFDRLDIYNVATDQERAGIQVEQALLKRYQHQRYGREETGGTDLQEPRRPSSIDRSPPAGPGQDDETGPAVQSPEPVDQVLETVGQAFIIIYGTLRNDDLDEETVKSFTDSLRDRSDYQSMKTAEAVEDLYDRFRQLDGDEERQLETFLTTLQDEYLG